MARPAWREANGAARHMAPAQDAAGTPDEWVPRGPPGVLTRLTGERDVHAHPW